MDLPPALQLLLQQGTEKGAPRLRTGGTGAEPGGNRPAPPGLRGGSGRQLVPGPGHRPCQRGSGGMEIQGPPGGTPPPAPVDAAHHGLRGTPH